MYSDDVYNSPEVVSCKDESRFSIHPCKPFHEGVVKTPLAFNDAKNMFIDALPLFVGNAQSSVRNR